ncbi:phage tail tube protein [Enterococcus italicus]
MAVNGNYKRKHYLAPFTGEETEPTVWSRLGNRISTMEDDSNEETDSSVFYDSLDGTAEETLLSRTEVWTFEGQYDPTDPAHIIIAKARRAEDEGRKVWHKIEETDGSTVVGVAKIFEPKAGGGDASAKEIISGRLAYIKAPTVTPKSGE